MKPRGYIIMTGFPLRQLHNEGFMMDRDDSSLLTTESGPYAEASLFYFFSFLFFCIPRLFKLEPRALLHQAAMLVAPGNVQYYYSFRYFPCYA